MPITACNKDVSIRYHFNRKAVNYRLVDISYVPRSEKVADTLTKTVLRVRFEKF